MERQTVSGTVSWAVTKCDNWEVQRVFSAPELAVFCILRPMVLLWCFERYQCSLSGRGATDR